MKQKNISVGKFLKYFILITWAVIVFFPLVTLFLTSFIPTLELATAKEFIWWSPNANLDGYKEIFLNDSYLKILGLPGLVMGFINTMWITLTPLLMGLLTAGLSAYSFSKMDFPYKEKLFKTSVIIRAIPLDALFAVSYIVFANIGWTGARGYLPLIIPGMFGNIGTLFFLRLYFDGIPGALVEAAELDGAGFFQCFFKVVFPLGKPAFVAQFIFGFVAGYNNYIGPLMYLQNQPRFLTLQLYLSQIKALFPNAGSENIHSAAAVLGMLPLILIYICMQKYFIEGITVGGVKE